MNKRAFDVGTALAVVLIGSGTGITWGVGPGLIAAGAVTLVVTFASALMAGVR